jgi:hypothetical protein
MKKKTKKQKIIYHEPPMKYNTALFKFEPDLPLLKKDVSQAKKQVITAQFAITAMVILIVMLIIVYIASQVR